MFGNRNDSSADLDSISNSFSNFKEERMNNYWKTIYIAFIALSYLFGLRFQTTELFSSYQIRLYYIIQFFGKTGYYLFRFSASNRFAVFISPKSLYFIFSSEFLC